MLRAIFDQLYKPSPKRMSQNRFAALLDSDSDSDVERTPVKTKSKKKPSRTARKTRVVKEESVEGKPRTKNYHPRPRVGTVPLREKRDGKGFKPRVKKQHNTREHFERATNTLVFETMIEEAKSRGKKLSQKERKHLEREKRKAAMKTVDLEATEEVATSETTTEEVVPEATC